MTANPYSKAKPLVYNDAFYQAQKAREAAKQRDHTKLVRKIVKANKSRAT